MALYNHNPLRNDPYYLNDDRFKVDWRILLGIVVLFSLAILALVNYEHQPVPRAAVTTPNVPLYSQASTTDTSSHVVGRVTLGDTVDVQAIRADGWCQVTLRDRRIYGDPGISGYIQQPALSMDDSTKAALL